MALSELERTLNRMKITIKATELPGTPARGFSTNIRNWRVILTRAPKSDEKALKLSLVILSSDEPTLETVVQCLAEDIEAAELTLWDFAQAFNKANKGKADPTTERMYKTCKRTGSRAQKFFGDSKLIRNMLGIAKAA